MIYVSGFMLVVWGICLALTLLGTWLACKRLTVKTPILDETCNLLPISILKPLKGIDHEMEKNLKSFFELDYPKFEILFSIADGNDPSRMIVERLIQKYPEIKAKLIVGGIEVGPNPKINNLIRSYEQAHYDLILISDSNIRVKADYLKTMMFHQDSRVGVITAIIAGRGTTTIGGKLEATYLNTFYARWMYLTQAIGQGCVVGKSMLFSKELASRFGGIRVLAKYLAEDYMTGIAMKRLGFSIEIMSKPVDQYLGSYSLGQFWKRHLRWGRIRKAQSPLAFLLEPMGGCLFSGLWGAYSIAYIWGYAFMKVFLIHVGMWSLCDLILALCVRKELSFQFLFVWILREFLAFPMWLHTVLGNTVVWRENRFKVQSGGILEVQSS